MNYGFQDIFHHSAPIRDCFVGWLYGYAKRPDMSVTNQVNMDIFTPALVFVTLGGTSHLISRATACWR